MVCFLSCIDAQAAADIHKSRIKIQVSSLPNSNGMTDLELERLGMQNRIADLEATINQLIKERDLYKCFFERLPYGAQLFDKEGYSYEFNAQAKEIWGFPGENFGIGVFNVLTDPFSVASGVDALCKRAYNGEVSRTEFEYDLGCDENQWDTRKERVVFEQTLIPIYDADNQVSHIASIVDDITSVRKAKERLASSEARFYKAFFANPAAMILIKAETGEVLEMNSSFSNALGYDRELIGKPEFITKLLCRPEVNHEMSRLLKSGSSIHNRQVGMRTKTGECIEVLLSIERIDIEGFTCLLLVFTDITRQKKAEEALKREKLELSVQTQAYYILFQDYKKQSEELQQAKERAEASESHLRHILDNMLEGCQILNTDWCYEYVNNFAELHNKRLRQELLGRCFTEVWPGVETTPLFKALERCMNEKIPLHFEAEFQFPEGYTGWFDYSVQPVPEGIFIRTIDITDRVLAERQLKAKSAEYFNLYYSYKTQNENLLREKSKGEMYQTQLRMMIENAPIPIFIQTQGAFAYVNQKAVELFGAADKASLTGQSVISRFHERFHKIVNQRIVNLNERKQAQPGIEEVIVRHDQSLLDVEVSAVPFRYAGHDGVLVFARDITVQKKYVREIEQTKNMFLQIAQNVPDSVICVVNRQFVVEYLGGQELRNLITSTRFPLVGKTLKEILPEVFREHKKALEQVFNIWRAYHTELKPEGNTFAITVLPVAENTEVLKLIIFARNITRQRMGEAVEHAKIHIYSCAKTQPRENLLHSVSEIIMHLTQSRQYCLVLIDNTREHNIRTRLIDSNVTPGFEVFSSFTHNLLSIEQYRETLLKEKRPLIKNRKDSHLGSATTCTESDRELIVPVVENEDVVGFFVLMNKPTDYNHDDLGITQSCSKLFGRFCVSSAQKRRCCKVSKCLLPFLNAQPLQSLCPILKTESLQK